MNETILEELRKDSSKLGWQLMNLISSAEKSPVIISILEIELLKLCVEELGKYNKLKQSARMRGRKGGRPRLPESELKPNSIRQREWRARSKK